MLHEIMSDTVEYKKLIKYFKFMLQLIVWIGSFLVIWITVKYIYNKSCLDMFRHLTFFFFNTGPVICTECAQSGFYQGHAAL